MSIRNGGCCSGRRRCSWPSPKPLRWPWRCGWRGQRREMNVFVAGGSGTIGIPLVSALVAAGHQVTALTRSAGRRDELGALGAAVAVADALDRDALVAAVAAARPTHVVHQLTALPKNGPRRAGDVSA